MSAIYKISFMKIRRLKIVDIKSASKIAGENHGKKYEKLAFLELEAMFKSCAVIPEFFVVEKSGQIVAFGGYIQSWFDYDIYEMFWVNVKLEYQRQGIGTALVKKIVSVVRKKKAKLLIISAAKPDYYSKKFGFKTVSKIGKQSLMGLKFK